MPCTRGIVKHHSLMKVGERVRFLREKKKLSGVQLAMRAGLDQSYLSKLEQGKVGFSEDGLRKIAKALGTTMAGLFGSANVSPVELDDRNRVRILDYIQAGLPAEVAAGLNDEDIAAFITVDRDDAEDLFALVIRGNSMEPAFTEGDVVLLKRSLAPQPGDYVVAVNGEGEAVFKRYKVQRTDESGRTVFALVPLNDDYPTLRSDELPLQIRGTMIEHRIYRKR